MDRVVFDSEAKLLEEISRLQKAGWHVSKKGEYKTPKYDAGEIYYAHKEIKPEEMAHGASMGTRQVELFFPLPKEGIFASTQTSQAGK